MRRMAFVLALVLGGSSFLACQDDPERPPAAGDLPQAPPLGGGAGGGGGGGGGGTGDGGVPLDGGGDGGTCTALASDGVVVDQNGVVGDAPTGSGGAIQDGTYELTAATVYVGAAGTPGPTGQQIQGALRIAGAAFERVQRQGTAGATPEEVRSSGTLSANGTTLTLRTSCPLAAQDQATYSVVANTLVVTSLVTRESYTFTLR